MEVVSASLNKEDVCNGVVSVSWAKGVPTWECYRVFVSFLQYEQSCFPMQRAASHVCCPPSFLLKVVRPVAYAIVDKRGRARELFHLESEEDILDVLATYGIPKECLPSEMGGKVVLNQLGWMADRRAAEMEEL